MCVMEFIIENVAHDEFRGKSVLEIGSKYINGSIRPFIEKWLMPKRYVGIDVKAGKFVDIVLSAEKLIEYFGRESFDVVIATEVIEHLRNWRSAIANMKEVLKEGGYMYVTAPSTGFVFHGFPFDFWRYETEDMHKIFSDFQIEVLKKDFKSFEVFLKARKPLNYYPNNITNIALYSGKMWSKTKCR